MLNANLSRRVFPSPVKRDFCLKIAGSNVKFHNYYRRIYNERTLQEPHTLHSEIQNLLDRLGCSF